MGCWNGTCGVSQLPILYGENVMYCFIKTNKATASGVCYAYDTGIIISPMFYGRYDDYGRIEVNGDDDKLRNFFNIVREKIGNKTLSIVPEEYYDKKIEDYSNAKDEDIMSLIERDRLYEGEDNIGIFFIKEQIFDAIIYEGTIGKCWGLKNEWLDEYEERFNDTVESVSRVLIGMNRISKTIAPSAGKGGQVYEYEDYDRFGKAYTSAVFKMKKAMKEEEEQYGNL